MQSSIGIHDLLQQQEPPKSSEMMKIAQQNQTPAICFRNQNRPKSGKNRPAKGKLLRFFSLDRRIP
jgi:hypothetical protein